MASFLWSVRVQTLGNCGRFVFHNDVYFFYQKPKIKQLALHDMLCHFQGLYSHRPQLSTNQCTRIRSVIVKSNVDCQSSMATNKSSNFQISYIHNLRTHHKIFNIPGRNSNFFHKYLHFPASISLPQGQRESQKQNSRRQNKN